MKVISKVGKRFRVNLPENVFNQNKKMLETLTSRQKKALKEKHQCDIFVVSVNNKARLIF